MKPVNNTRYANFFIKYVFAWKINDDIFINLQNDNIRLEIEKSVQDVCENYHFNLKKIIIEQRYVVLSVDSIPKYAPSDIISKFKGVSGRRIGMSQKTQKIWDKGYLCFTEGECDTNKLGEYLKIPN